MSEGFFQVNVDTVESLVNKIRQDARKAREVIDAKFKEDGKDGERKKEDNRIKKLMGDRFEILTLRLLKVEKDFELDPTQIWLWKDSPYKPTDRSGIDVGVDIVAVDLKGRTIAIQCKCFEEGKIITKSNIDSFLAELNQKYYDRGLLITPNFTGGHASLNLKTPCQEVNILDKYRDTKISKDILNRKPLPHQEKAIKSVTEGFFPKPPTREEPSQKEHHRGKLIMPCGSGKTFTALCIAKEFMTRKKTSSRILLVVPSIALVDQTRREWLRCHDGKLLTLCVCSDGSTGRFVADSADITTNELVGTVSTNPEEIKEFLNPPSEPLPSSVADHKVVFCTYQSLHKVSEALEELPEDFSFDLAIADEAHRTTGALEKDKKDETNWRLFHNKDKLRVKKRLYMTATPKIYTRKSKKYTLIPIADMSDTQTYGIDFYTLSLREAVKSGQLCDYRIIIPILTGKNVSPTDPVKKELEELEKKVYQTPKKLEPIDKAKLIGTSIAINGFIEGGNKIEIPDRFARTLLFANTIKKSQWIAEALSSQEVRRLISVRAKKGARENQLSAIHMDAKTPSWKRSNALDKLRNTKNNECNVICNVRIFSEGVDIPALDAIVFFDERKSQIDIMQSIGRVLRKADGKKLGYIFLPVFAPGDDVLKGLEEGGGAYSHIAKVFRALQAHDPNFVDCWEDYVHIVEPSLGVPINSEGSPIAKIGEQQDLGLEIIARIKTRIVEETGINSRKDLVANVMKTAIERIGKRFDDNELTQEIKSALDFQEEENKTSQLASGSSIIGALILINALLITKKLAHTIGDGFDENILTNLAKIKSPYRQCKKIWGKILKKDYKPIFAPALSVLKVLENDMHADLITDLAVSAQEISASISDFSYDHSGPLFCEVLGERGTADGAFYTDNLAAYMMASLALPKENLEGLKVIDPTCGTGTLLLAALEMMKNRIAQQYPEKNRSSIHRNLVEKTIYGLDINYHATQFTAMNFTLGDVAIYDKMNVETLKEGVVNGDVYAGSLSLLRQINSDKDAGLFSRLQKQSDKINDLSIGGAKLDIPLGTFDVVLMNPPFTNMAKLVKKFPTEDREKFRANLETIRKRLIEDDKLAEGVCGKGNAFGPYFVLLAQKLLKKKGTLTMVMPTSALTSVSGVAQRQYLAKYFHIDTVMTSHEKNNVNFSVGCSINESLLILRKINVDEQEKRETRNIVFHKKPKNLAETQKFLAALKNNQEDIITQYAQIHWWQRKLIKKGKWSFACWYNSNLAREALKIRENTNLVRFGDVGDFVSMLGKSGILTIDNVGENDAQFSILYGTGNKKRPKMLTVADTPAKLKISDTEHRLYNKKGDFFIAFAIDIQSTRLIALRTAEETFSMSYTLCQPSGGEEYKNALCVFLNSTVGWVQMLNWRTKKLVYGQYDTAVVKKIGVPAPSSPHIDMLAEVYEQYKEAEVEQNRNAHYCPVRKAFDDAVAKVLDVPTEDIDTLRNMMANEPLIKK